MTTSNKFALVLPSVKPGDFGPTGYAVYGVDWRAESRVVGDGDVVEALAEVEYTQEREYTDEGMEIYEIAHRMVRLADGFEGHVCWHDFNGHSGFRRL